MTISHKPFTIKFAAYYPTGIGTSDASSWKNPR
jgi:hypothetical protein